MVSITQYGGIYMYSTQQIEGLVQNYCNYLILFKKLQ